MKVVLVSLLALIFNGCVTYDAGKDLYVVGREVVKINADNISPETMAKLKALDTNAKLVDLSVEVIKKNNVDTNSTKTE